MKKYFFSVVLILSFLFSCSNSFLVNNQKDKKDEDVKTNKTGNVTILFSTSPYNKNISRTVVADFTTLITNWNVKISKGSVNFNSSGTSGSATFNDLEPGVWSVLIDGKDASDRIIADGTSDITINEGTTETCTINTRFRQMQSGSFSLTFEYPASSGIGYAEAKLDDGALFTATIYNSNPTTHKATFTQTGVTSGGHELVFTFRKGGASGDIAGMFREMINIWDYTESNKFLSVDGTGNITFSDVKTFTENDLSDRNANLSGITITNCVLDSAFDFSNTSYNCDITSDTFTFTPTGSIAGQTIKYSWNGAATDTAITSGTTSASLLIGNTGNHVLLVKVTSPDRINSKTYTFNCVRKYRVIYDANYATSGTSPTDNNYYVNGASITVLGNTGGLSKTDKRFMGWNLQANARGRDYDFGNTSLKMGTSDITLYARWGITYAEAKTLVPVTPPTTQFQLQGKIIALSPFEIGKYEVTRELWKDVKDWATGNDYTICNNAGEANSNRAISHVTWRDIVVWCNAYSEKNNLKPVYYTDSSFTTVLKISTNDAVNTTPGTQDNPYICQFADGYRLPTEAELEFAARGGDPSNTANWNYIYAGSDAIDEVAWYKDNSCDSIHDVGLRNPNSLGLYDMSGNASEFCSDGWSDLSSWDTGNPLAISTQDSKVFRGGSYADSFYAGNNRMMVAHRENRYTYWLTEVGFRVARNLGTIIGRKSGSGGIIFYDKGSVTDGWRYLEIAPANLVSTYKWSDQAIEISLNDTDIGYGKFNSFKIENMTKSGGQTSNAAIGSENCTFGGFDDWYLPNIKEIEQVRMNLHDKGMGGMGTLRYWGSIGGQTGGAWTYDFNPSASPNGINSYSDGQDSTHYVRPIRAFREPYNNKPTYVVVYDKNGADVTGTVPTAPKYYEQGEEITVLPKDPELINSGFNFAGWNTKANGSGTTYRQNDKITVTNQNIVLYAWWSSAIPITNQSELAAIGTNAESLSKSYILMNDITLTGEWNRIGSSSTPFTGTFNGNGNTISGLTISSITNINNRGLFGNTDTTSVIKNLNLSGVNISNGNDSVGTLIGYNKGEVTNCHVLSGSVSGKSNVGGLIGSNQTSTAVVYKSSASVTVTGTSSGIGGLIGTVTPTGGAVSYSYATGNVSATGTAAGTISAGGLIGDNQSSDTISNSYAMGNVSVVGITGNTVNAGGLIGYRNYGNVSNSYSTGSVSVSGAGTTNYGGLIGSKGVSSMINDSYYDTNTSGKSDTGKGEPLVTADMKDKTKYSGWDFTPSTGIWAIGSGNNMGYPYLLNNYPTGVYTVLYEGNGSTGGVPPYDNTFYKTGDTVTVKAKDPALVNGSLNFIGWNTKADGTGTTYIAGNTITVGTQNIVLYAMWSSNSYTMISDAAGLASIGANPTTLAGKYILTSDITLSGDWTPIGNSDFFTGSFDGNGYKINNLTINNTTAGIISGLFGKVNTPAVIKNLTLVDVDVSSTIQCAGSLIASMSGGTVENCHVISGTINGYWSTGGLIGAANNSTIKNCSSHINVNISTDPSISSASYIGGLIGSIGYSTSIENCYATGNVTDSKNYQYIGGLVGFVEITNSIKNCYATGNVSGNYTGNTYIGGLVGYFKAGTISYSYSTGAVTGETYVGGLIGKADTALNYCYYDTNTSGRSDTGKGEPLTTVNMKDSTKISTNYTIWDFTIVWGIDALKNRGYPYLLSNYHAANLTVNFSTKPDYYSLVFTPSAVSVSKNGTIDITTNSVFNDVAQWKWYLNGTEDTGQTTKKFTFTAGTTLGDNIISCSVMLGKVMYSGSLKVTVKE